MSRMLLAESHKAQIAEMLKDEKPWGEIIKFMNRTYSIEVKNHHIAYIKKTMFIPAASGKPAKGKRAYHRRKGGVVKFGFTPSPRLDFPPEDLAEGLSDGQIKERIMSGIQEISSSSRKLLVEILIEIDKIKLQMALATGISTGKEEKVK